MRRTGGPLALCFLAATLGLSAEEAPQGVSPVAAAVTATAAIAMTETATAVTATAAAAVMETATAAPLAAAPVATSPPSGSAAEPDGAVGHVQTEFPAAGWTIALNAGPALPLGTLAGYAAVGGAVSLDLLYRPADSPCRGDTFIDYSNQAYTGAPGAPSLSNAGVGVKLLYDVVNADGITWYLGAGAGAFYDQRTKQVLRQPVLNNTPEFDPAPDDSFAVGLLGVLGGDYQFPSGWGLSAELDILSLNLAGGTSDSLLIAQPLLGLQYKL